MPCRDGHFGIPETTWPRSSTVLLPAFCMLPWHQNFLSYSKLLWLAAPCCHRPAFLDICLTSYSIYLSSFTAGCDSLPSKSSAAQGLWGNPPCPTHGEYRGLYLQLDSSAISWMIQEHIMPSLLKRELILLTVRGWAHCNTTYYWFFSFLLSSVCGCFKQTKTKSQLSMNHQILSCSFAYCKPVFLSKNHWICYHSLQQEDGSYF